MFPTMNLTFLPYVDDSTDLQGKVLLVTGNEYVKVVFGQINIDVISPCSHEEADTKVILHCLHAS